MVEARKCSVEGCGKRWFAVALCAAHYARKRKYGSVDGKAPSYSKRLKWLKDHASHSSDECLRWPFAILPDGYGHMDLHGVSMKASRAMCIIAHGKPESEELEAAHSCGKGHEGCVNPKHLRWATRDENIAEFISGPRLRRGEKHAQHKLSNQEVIAIREAAGKESHRATASRFDISHTLVQKIQKRLTWTHI